MRIKIYRMELAFVNKKNLLSTLFIPFTLMGPEASQAGTPAARQESDRPNILFIAVDDLKPILGCYGHPLVKTPNIDRIAARGTVFLNNFCQQAVCGPTRASLMTGMRPDFTRVWDLKTRMRDINPDILSLPQYLISQGYSTQGIGKIYDQRCVDEFLDKPSWSVPYHTAGPEYFDGKLGRPVLGRYQSPEVKNLVKRYDQEAAAKGLKGSEANDYVQLKIKPSTECLDVPDNAYGDGANTLKAKEILTSLSQKKQPFFFATGFAKPHLPFVAPKKYWDLYDRKSLPLAPFQEHAEGSPVFAYHHAGELRGYTDIPEAVAHPASERRVGLAEDKQRELIHGYYAAVSYTDAQIGILLDALDSLGLADNTIIVLWGDHGWHLGDHDLWCKHSTLEQATRAPLLISSPGQKPGKTKAVSEFVDIFPTLCQLAGLPVPAHLHGKSLVPLMKDPSGKVKEFAVSQYPRQMEPGDVPGVNISGKKGRDLMGYTIRSERYRYTLWLNNDFRSYMPYREDWVVASELFDYQVDPLEKVNLAKNVAYKEVTHDMHRMITEFFRQHEQVR